MHSLEANLALPHALEQALLNALGCTLSALAGVAEMKEGLGRKGALAEERARRAKDVARGCHPV